MCLPPLLSLPTVEDYRDYFERNYCRSVVMTHDRIRVYFGRQKFDHAFFESSNRDGAKDVFSAVRAERMDWINATILNPAADRYQGWDARSRSYDPVRRVDVVYEDFVVVLHIGRKREGGIKANFVTCYQADNSIAKIRSSPRWTLQDCLNAL